MYTKLGDIPAILSEAIVNDSLVSWINASEWNCENRRNRLISFGAQPTNLANRLNVTNTALRGKLKSTEISSNTGRFVWEGNQLNGYAALASNQIPSDLTKGRELDPACPQLSSETFQISLSDPGDLALSCSSTLTQRTRRA